MGNLLAQFREYLLSLGISQGSVSNYLSDLNHFQAWLTQTYPRQEFNQVSIEHALAYRTHLSSELNAPVMTVNRRLSSLRKFFTWAAQQGVVSANPMVGVSNISLAPAPVAPDDQPPVPQPLPRLAPTPRPVVQVAPPQEPPVESRTILGVPAKVLWLSALILIAGGLLLSIPIYLTGRGAGEVAENALELVGIIKPAAETRSETSFRQETNQNRLIESLDKGTQDLSFRELATQELASSNQGALQNFDSNSDNSIQNSSFELSGSGQPSAWQYFNFSNPSNTQVTSVTSHTGGQSLQFTLDGIKYGGLDQPQSLTRSSGGSALSVWIRTSGLSYDGVVKLGFKNDKGVYSGYNLFYLGGSNGWQRLTVSANAAGLYPAIEFRGYSKGIIYLDDWQLTDGSNQVLYSQNGQLGQGSILASGQATLRPIAAGAGSLGVAANPFGALYLAQASIDTAGNFNLSGTMTSRNIQPAADDTFDLGTTSARYRNLYVDHFLANSGGTSGDFAVAGNLSVTGSSTLSGNILAGSNFTAVGSVTSATLTTTGDASIGGNLGVTGTTLLTGLLTAGEITSSGNFTQTGATTFSTGTGAISLNGDVTLASGKNLNTSGHVTLGYLPTSASDYTLAAKPAATNPTGRWLYNGSTYTDIGVMMGSNTDLKYYGFGNPFVGVYLSFSTPGLGYTISAQYSKGGGVWGALTITDGTANFTTNGSIYFTPPGDWATDSVNGVTNYWIRFSSGTSPTTTAVTSANYIEPTGYALAAYLSPVDTTPKFYVDYRGNVQVSTMLVAQDLSVTGSVGSSLIPSINNAFDLGSVSKYWSNAYVNTLTANNISAGNSSISGTTSETFTINSDNNPANPTESLIFSRSTVPNPVLAWDNPSQSFTLNGPLTLSSGTGTATVTAAGTINSTGGGFQTNSTTRVDNAGNLMNIGSFTSGLTPSGSTAVNLIDATLTNNTTSGIQKGLALTLAGSGVTEDGVYINYSGSGSGTTGLEIAGTWGMGILTNNNSINAGTGTINSGSVTSSGKFIASNGSAAAPSFTFTNSIATGLYRAGTDILGISTGGLEAAQFNPVASAVNFLSFSPSATGVGVQVAAAGTDPTVILQLQSKGNAGVDISSENTNFTRFIGATSLATPGLRSAGGDTNIGYNLSSKGTGTVSIQSGSFARNIAQFLDAANSVNYFTFTPSATGNPISMQAQGTDTNVGINIQPRGSGNISLLTTNGNSVYIGNGGTNYWAASPNTAGNGPIIQAQGSDTNIISQIWGKGTGGVNLGGNQANSITVTGAASLSTPSLSAVGSDGTINLNLASKGSGSSVVLLSGNQNAFVANSVASGVNYLTTTGAIAGGIPLLASTGGDTNIDLSLQGKGNGAIRLANQQTNFITISSAVTTAAPQISTGNSGDTNVDLVIRSSGSGALKLGANQYTNFLTVAGATTGNPVTLKVTDSGDTNVGLTLKSRGTGTILALPGADSASAFEVKNAGNTSAVLDVDTSNLRVGVGTASPGSTLQIGSNTGGTSTWQLFVSGQGATSATYGIVDRDSGGNDVFWSRDDGYVYMKGNVGINQESPTQKLEIYNGNLLKNVTSEIFTTLAAPGAPTVGVGAATGLTGTFNYQVTFITASGETEGGTVSSNVTVSNQKISLTAIPTGTAGVVTARKIYRSTAGPTTPRKLVTTINDNSTTTYTDSTADASLGIQVPTYNTTASFQASGTQNIVLQHGSGQSVVIVDSSTNQLGKLSAGVLDPYLITNTGTTQSALEFRTTNTGGLDDFVFEPRGTEKGRIDTSGNLTLSGTLTATGVGSSTFSGQILAINGTAGAPSYAFTNSTGTGLYRAGTDVLGVSTAGSLRMQLDALGNLSLTPGAASSGSVAALTLTAPADTGLTNAEFKDINFNLNRTVTFTGSATPGAANIATQRAILLQAPTYAFGSTGAQTITNAATLAIAAAPAAGTNASITNSYALWTQAGLNLLDGLGTRIKSTATGNSSTQTTTFGYVIGNTTEQQFMDFGGSGYTYNIGTSLTTQRFALFDAPTISICCGTNTVNDTATVAIAGAVKSTGNLTTTNSYGLWIQSGAVTQTNNAYGLNVQAPTGGTVANYAAIFQGGNVGIGTTAPSAKVEISGTAIGNASTLKLTDTGASGKTYQLGEVLTAGNFEIYDTAVGSRLTIQGSSGNVGIGATAPNSGRLQVAGAINTSGTIGVGIYNTANPVAQANGDALYANFSDITFSKNSFTGLSAFGNRVRSTISGSGTITNYYGIYLDPQTGATNNYALVSDPNAGNVGIGTFAPTNSLNVVGGITGSGIAAPTNSTFTQGAGTLATATYYYRVTALTSAGETTPSTETSLAITGPAGVNVNWGAVSGATGYKVYGRSTGAELLIATITSGATTTFLDNGSVTPSGAMPTSNTTGNTYLVSNGFGSVGIGTTSPGVGILEIKKSSTFSTENTSGLSINTGTSAQPQLQLGADNGNTVGYIQAMSKGTSFTTVPLALQPNGGNVSIGSTPSSSGTLRFPNAGTLIWRNQGNSGDVQGITVGTNNQVVLGANAGTDVQVGTGFLQVGTNPAASGSLRIPNASGLVGRNSTNAGDIALIQASSTNDVLIDPASNGARTGTFLVLGASAAGAGQLRLPNNTNIEARNAAGNGDDILIGSNASNQVQLGGATFSTVLVGSAGGGKITAGTFDPQYTIDGGHYATFGLSAIGVKEEMTGEADLGYDPDSSLYKYVIDLENQVNGSDLWVFSRVTDPDLNLTNVLLTADQPAKTWYVKDPSTRTITLYSDRPVRLSYRLTGARFDHTSWPTASTDSATGLTAPADTFVAGQPSAQTITYQGGFTENFQTADTSITVGDVLSVVSGGVAKSAAAYDQQLLGVAVSHTNNSVVSVAPAGKVSVKVSIGNGPIAVGDHLTASGAAGVAMKLSQAGRTLGIALQGATANGTILVEVNPGWFDPNSTVYAGNGTVATSTTTTDATFNSITATTATITNLNVGGIKIVADTNGNLKVNGSVLVTGSGTFGSISVNGLLSLYGGISAPNGLVVKLGSGTSLTIQDSTGATKASISDKGEVAGSSIQVSEIKIATDSATPVNNTTGAVILTAGSKQLVVNSNKVSAGSKVFVTFQGDYSPASRYWVDAVVSGTSFVVNLDQPVTKDVNLTWWIVN